MRWQTVILILAVEIISVAGFMPQENNLATDFPSDLNPRLLPAPAPQSEALSNNNQSGPIAGNLELPCPTVPNLGSSSAVGVSPNQSALCLPRPDRTPSLGLSPPQTAPQAGQAPPLGADINGRAWGVPFTP